MLDRFHTAVLVWPELFNYLCSMRTVTDVFVRFMYVLRSRQSCVCYLSVCQWIPCRPLVQLQKMHGSLLNVLWLNRGTDSTVDDVWQILATAALECGSGKCRSADRKLRIPGVYAKSKRSQTVFERCSWTAIWCTHPGSVWTQVWAVEQFTHKVCINRVCSVYSATHCSGNCVWTSQQKVVISCFSPREAAVLARSWDRNCVRPSVCPSHTSFWRNERTYRWYFDTTWKSNHSSFLKPTEIVDNVPFHLKFALKVTHSL